MATKDTKETAAGATATVEAEQVAVPQTAEQIAATEKALGLSPAPANGQTVPAKTAKVPVRMGVAPTNLEEGWRLAQFIAQSELVPKGYQGRPADVLVAIQYGMEVGLPPMAALHSIYVTNGRPSLWGDGFLAVIMASPLYKDHDEYFIVDGERREFLTAADMTKDETMAVTTFWRTDSARPRTATFSVAKAKKAGLWTKQGPWTNYPDRMLMFRARGFSGHNAFPDVLRGIRSAEEVIDMGPDTIEAEPVKQVQRISETAQTVATVDGKPGGRTAPDPPVVEAEQLVELGPFGVKDVDQFLGGFTVTLSNGQKIDTIEAAEAMDLDKYKGTKHQVRLVCVKAADGNLQLKSFAIAD